jgi:hypothetical protein
LLDLVGEGEVSCVAGQGDAMCDAETRKALARDGLLVFTRVK